jgi:hypothetical protein
VSPMSTGGALEAEERERQAVEDKLNAFEGR